MMQAVRRKDILFQSCKAVQWVSRISDPFIHNHVLHDFHIAGLPKYPSKFNQLHNIDSLA